MAPLVLVFVGKSCYEADVEVSHHRLLVNVRCQIGNHPDPFQALLDTGSEWCVLRSDIAEALGYDSTPDPAVGRLDTRFGKFPGRLERLPLIFEADEGDNFEIEATWFVADGWPGPPVIGWKGCLERMRFALDPSEDAFYFANL